MDRPWPRVKYAENFHHSTSTPVEPTEKNPTPIGEDQRTPGGGMF